MNLDKVHKFDMRGNHVENWAKMHRKWIRFQENLFILIASSFEITNNNFEPSNEYIIWFCEQG